LLRRLTVCTGLLVVLFTIGTGTALAAPPPGWGAIDLGTLGGSTSHANAVNTAGEVVGDSTVAGDMTTHAFAWTPAGGMQDLGTLGGSYSSAVAVNTSGQVAGYATTATEALHAVRWSAAGVIQDLGDLGGDDSSAVAINDAGTVVGTSMTAALVEHAFSYSGNGPMRDLGTLGGTYSTAVGINASGQVIGSSTLAGDLEEHAVVWSGVTMTDIGTAGWFSRPTAINDAGQVVGYRSPLASPEAQTGFLWNQGTALTAIGTASSFTSANAINATGQVVGVAPPVSDPTVLHAFTYQNGVFTDIGTLGGTFGAAYSVSASGQVVGTSTLVNDDASHAFVWTQGGTMLDLGTLGGDDSYGVAVNKSAQVIAFSTTASGDTHAVVWQRDTTAPVVTAQVTGTLGQNGWYTGNVTVAWTATDAQTPITTPACASSAVSADTAGTTITCTATSGGGTTTKSVTIKRDATPPVVAFAAHPDSYSANQSVVIGCSASDVTSGLATTCQGVNTSGALLPLGLNTRSTTATDKAGNTTTVTTSFTMTAALPSTPTPSSVCLLMQKDVQGSAKYASLQPMQRLVVDVLTSLGCSWVKAIAPKMSPSQQAGLVASFKNTVTSLLAGGWILAADAATLRAQVDQL
jgi:probable HAF family extracellular repeat protein